MKTFISKTFVAFLCLVLFTLSRTSAGLAATQENLIFESASVASVPRFRLGIRPHTL